LQICFHVTFRVALTAVWLSTNISVTLFKKVCSITDAAI